MAGAVTGSIAIITEAVHSSIDLLASIVAYLSLRKADEPADARAPVRPREGGEPRRGDRGHADPGRRRRDRVRGRRGGSSTGAARSTNIGFGIAVIAVSAVVNLVVSTYLYRQARAHDSPALEGDAAHLRADAVDLASPCSSGSC